MLQRNGRPPSPPPGPYKVAIFTAMCGLLTTAIGGAVTEIRSHYFGEDQARNEQTKEVVEPRTAGATPPPSAPLFPEVFGTSPPSPEVRPVEPPAPTPVERVAMAPSLPEQRMVARLQWIGASVSPSGSPLQVETAPPLATKDDRFLIRVRMTSTVPDLVVWATNHGDVDGFSASVRDSGAQCIGGGYELNGVRSFRQDRWLQDHFSEMTRIPAGQHITVTDEFICRGTPVRAGETATATLTINYLEGGRVQSAQVVLPDQILQSRNAFEAR